MDFLKNKYYGLPGWAWVGVVGAGVFIYWRLRSGSSTASSADSLQSGQDQTAGAEGAAQGYVQGYDQGFQQGTMNPPTTPPAGSAGCVQRKDPSGKMHQTCGPGFWVKGASGGWRWVEGPKPNGPIHIVKGKGGAKKKPKKVLAGHGTGGGGRS